MNQSGFESIWRRNLRPGAVDRARAVFVAVQAAYQESHRHYHNDEHIDHCLALLHDVHDQLLCPDAVELAIWFHDVVYESGAIDNEQRSAEWFLRQSEGQLTENIRQQVADLIMSTTHDEPPKNLDARILLDIDLSSFGLSWERFREDGENVRKEQQHLSDREFYRRQMRFQESLLQRARFYFSDYFYRRFEANARENLTRHLALLRSRGFHPEPSS
jgi:predicted metal-dependent HD superfamily phosphohydrolase